MKKIYFVVNRREKCSVFMIPQPVCRHYDMTPKAVSND